MSVPFFHDAALHASIAVWNNIGAPKHTRDIGAPLYYIALYDYTATRHKAYETPAADHLQDQIFCSRP